MTSNRPYLLRALYEWIVDNNLTPHVLLNAGVDGVEIPSRAIRNGKVVLNISPAAVQQLDMGSGYLHCSARFSGQSCRIVVPMTAILAIYAQENGQGMMFADEALQAKDHDESSAEQGDGEPRKKNRSHLKVVN